MTNNEKWIAFAWHCPECGAKVTGYKNRQGTISLKCPNCRIAMVRTFRGRRHETIDLYASTELKKDKNEAHAKIVAHVKERDETLFSLDRDRITKYFQKKGADVPEDDTIFWAGVYLCICHIPSAPEDLVRKAKEWLHAHGRSENISF